MTATATAVDFDPRTRRDYTWLPSGQSVLRGDLLTLAARLDRLFLRWAMRWDAEEIQFPATIPAEELQKLDYFRSFPHLATFPACLEDEEEALHAFAREPMDAAGQVRLTRAAPLRDALTPAACYHLYALLQGRHLPARRVATTRATCFRRERSYTPLQRQWSFSMREVVCLGTAPEVESFLDEWRRVLRRFAEAMALPVSFAPATDPFFSPPTSAAYLAQRVEPSKTEMVLEGGLAIASLNDHRTTFGEAFGIAREERPVRSACVAFGLERWLFAALSHAARLEVSPLEWMAEAERHA
jgi:hypothetical protein